MREPQPRAVVSEVEVLPADLERLFWERRFEDCPEDPWLADPDDVWLADLFPDPVVIDLTVEPTIELPIELPVRSSADSPVDLPADLPFVSWRARPENAFPEISWRVISWRDPRSTSRSSASIS